uniref:Hypothetical secreted peptide 467 n=1 Tax=Amblyomma variegatum TaxID=34610 RepID=F0JA54_AMBVA|nr:TPA_inf: hypothetical secreted peptide precursor 467 [Amblyomma variegatum]
MMHVGSSLFFFSHLIRRILLLLLLLFSTPFLFSFHQHWWNPACLLAVLLQDSKGRICTCFHQSS